MFILVSKLNIPGYTLFRVYTLFLNLSHGSTVLQAKFLIFPLNKLRSQCPIRQHMDTLQSFFDNFRIKLRDSQYLTNSLLQFIFRKRGSVVANGFPMLNSIGTAPDDFTGETGDAPVYAAAFGTNKKATQYILIIVLGRLSLVGALIYAASFALLILNRKVIFKTDNGVDILCIAQHLIENRLAPTLFAGGGGDVLFKKEIGNTSQALSIEILSIDFLYNRCLFGNDLKQAIARCSKSIYFFHV